MSVEEASRLITLYSDVQSEKVRWFWYPFIAYGKVTLLQGDPGDGKSTMMLSLISELSTGGMTPDGKDLGRPQHVIYQCSEDGAADTIKPRLEKCGADCRNIAFIDEEVHNGITLDDERLYEAIAVFRPKLVVIDPIQAYINNSSDLQVAARARRLLRRLSTWAEAFDCAVVLIGHMNKHEGARGLYRGIGSIDVVASARSVLQIERDNHNPDIRILRQIKNSLGPSDAMMRFEIRKDTGFRWIGTGFSSGHPVPEQEPENKVLFFSTKTEKAAYLIRTYLKNGMILSNEMYQRLEAEGISHRTAEKTRLSIGVICRRVMNRWYWSLPNAVGEGKEPENAVSLNAGDVPWKTR